MAKSANTMPFIPASTNSLPAHLTKDAGMGSENVGSDSLVTPRLILLQTISPQCNKRKADYIEGAEEGKFLNSVTKELSDSVLCINLFFEKNFVLWKKREAGGGLIGTFDSQLEAHAFLKENSLDLSEHDAVETDRHYLLLLDDKGVPTGPAVIDMSASKLRQSKEWNTKLEMTNNAHKCARFATVWRLDSFVQESAENSWANIGATEMGFADEKLYELAKQGYDSIKRTNTSQAA